MAFRIAILAEFPISSLNGKAEGRGGGQTCTWLPQLAQAFEHNREFEIHWIILDRKSRHSTVIQKMGQHFHRISSVRFSLDLLLDYLPARIALKKAIRKIDPHLVHAWGTEHIYSCALQDYKGPSVLSMQGILTEYSKIGGLPASWLWRKMIKSEPKFVKSATIVTSESQWGIDRVKEFSPESECRKVEYGVHPSFYDLQWSPDPAKPYALYVGGTGSRKGLDILIGALKEIPDRDWEIRLAGDVHLQNYCDNAGITKFRCLGLLTWDEMKVQLQGAWCSVLPTRGDTSPNSIKEARVVGVPVVTSVHGGQSEYIKDRRNGRIANPLNKENLAEALSDVMSSIQRSVQLGKCRHQEDREYFSPTRTADSFAEIYSELLK